MKSFFLTFVVLACGFSQLSYAARDREVSVSGTCTRWVVPDRGAIVLTAEAQEMDLKTATARASRIYERTLEEVKKLALADFDLKTVEYSVQEVKEWEKNRSVSRGFKARMGMKVSTSNTQKLGDVISVAAREEVRDVGQLRMFLSDEKQRKEHFACLQVAAEHARAKAERLAIALNAKVSDVLQISEVSGGTETRSMSEAYDAPMLKTASGGATVDVGQQQLTVSVQAIFGLR